MTLSSQPIGTVVAQRGENSVDCTRCGTSVRLHGVFWCEEVCPKCLQSFAYGLGADNGLRVAAGFWYGAGEQRIRQWIADCGGRYVPRFRDETPAEAIANCA